jgi:hypothetical protein
MDKPRSWTFNLKIDYHVIHETDWKTRIDQTSPLRFESKSDAFEFGKKVFEPPLSVVEWSVIGSDNKPNFPLKTLENRRIN